MSGRKKRKHEEAENAERWLLTYADMITLLVAFFMMMYSMSVINLEKFKQAAIGIRSGFNGPVALAEKAAGESIIEKGSKVELKPELPNLVNQPFEKPASAASPSKPHPQKSAKQVMREQRIGALTEKINQRLSQIAGGQAAKVQAESKGVAIELVGDLIFFPRTSAELSEAARKILVAVAGVLSEVPNEISAEGHASTAASTQDSGATSWELSTARATSVVKYLLKAGKIDPKRVAITGYGEYRPLTPGKDRTVTSAKNDVVRIFIYQD